MNKRSLFIVTLGLNKKNIILNYVMPTKKYIYLLIFSAISIYFLSALPVSALCTGCSTAACGACSSTSDGYRCSCTGFPWGVLGGWSTCKGVADSSCCSSGKINCSGTCYTGNCCSYSNCPSPSVCYKCSNHTCAYDNGYSCGTNKTCSNGSCVCEAGYTNCGGTCRAIFTGTCCGGVWKTGSGTCCSDIWYSGTNKCCSDSNCDSCYECSNHSCVYDNGSFCGTNKVCSNGSCVCAQGYTNCSGTCYLGNCCVNSDCSSGQTCSNHSCVTTYCNKCETADCGACSSTSDGYRCQCSGSIWWLPGHYTTCAGVSDTSCCSSGKVSCSGTCYSGDCCVNSDCSSGYICTNHNCTAQPTCSSVGGTCVSSGNSCFGTLESGSCSSGVCCDAATISSSFSNPNGTYTKTENIPFSASITVSTCQNASLKDSTVTFTLGSSSKTVDGKSAGAATTFSDSFTNPGTSGQYTASCSYSLTLYFNMSKRTVTQTGSCGSKTITIYSLPVAEITGASGGTWKKSPSFTVSMSFSDQGGPGLKTCEYKIGNGGWLSAGICSGTNVVPLSKTITVGSSGNCSGDTCIIYVRAQDNSNQYSNVSQQEYLIDYTPPATKIN